MQITHPRRLSVLAFALFLTVSCGDSTPVDNSGPVADWPEYGKEKGGIRFSPLTQINRDNVDELEIAWIHHHGDVSDGSNGNTRTSFNATPLMVEDTLYFCTGFNRVIALDATTGEERWAFDPKQDVTKLDGPYPRSCRGVTYWKDPAPRHWQGNECLERIFTGTLDSQLIALDAKTGEPCPRFGKQGRVALREGLGDAEPWEYYPTSPPVAVHDVVVVGALVSDNLRVDAPSGVVRGFDARTGRLRWAWDPVPPGWSADELPPGTEYTPGTANVWSIMSADPERGLVFVPTGNAAPDYFGGNRRGLDHYSSSTVALDAYTGEAVWHFQTVHHDVWDYDVASQPTLFEFKRGGETIPAVAQATKMGHVFLLHRETGKPLFPVEERPVPQGAVPGETLSPTQPFPTHIPPLHPQTLTPDDAFGFSFWDRGKCAEIISQYRSEGLFTPPSLQGSIEFPGAAGGANWGSVAIDPNQGESGVLLVNQMQVPVVVTLIPRAEYDAMENKTAVYPEELYPMEGTPYAVHRGPLLSPLGAPCNPPPWGTLTAVDLASGEVLWESPLGTSRDQAPFPIWWLQGNIGAPNLGGGIVTAGGLYFIGATTDKYLRAFDTATGEEVWRHRIPFTANSTPLTYRIGPDGRQYVVVAAGGHGWSEPGDTTIAFALP